MCKKTLSSLQIAGLFVQDRRSWYYVTYDYEVCTLIFWLMIVDQKRILTATIHREYPTRSDTLAIGLDWVSDWVFYIVQLAIVPEHSD